jgi:hypothetical protein
MHISIMKRLLAQQADQNIWWSSRLEGWKRVGSKVWRDREKRKGKERKGKERKGEER